jgi:hypothetical protein
VTGLGPHDSAFVLISPLDKSAKKLHLAEGAPLAASQKQPRVGMAPRKTGNAHAAVSFLKTDEQVAVSVSSSGRAPSFRTGCTDDASCSFNGICSQQQCDCVSGWRGSACEKLDLEEAAGTGSHFTGATAGLNLLNPFQNWTSTWGGSVVKGRDGNFHMFAAMMVDQCRLPRSSVQACHPVRRLHERVFCRSQVASMRGFRTRWCFMLSVILQQALTHPSRSSLLFFRMNRLRSMLLPERSSSFTPRLCSCITHQP